MYEPDDFSLLVEGQHAFEFQSVISAGKWSFSRFMQKSEI